jgi:transglutaminase-like putative cysteine protease
MQRLTIAHETRYVYERPVGFAPHFLLIRPRGSHALRLIDSSLQLSLPGEVRWLYDALGNCVCRYTPQGEATELSIVSNLTLERYPAFLEAEMDKSHCAYPIVYNMADRIALAPMIMPATEDESGTVISFLQRFLTDPHEPVLYLLERINNAIHDEFEYGARDEEGAQSPLETIGRGAGACRDFAWLMVEGLRRLGFAARFVSGYLHSPKTDIRGAGATHAWCQVFLPGLGWTEFDPTNGLAESADLIPVAVARTPWEASPISGAVIGDPGQSNLEVKVRVDLVTQDKAAAVQAA